MYKKGCIVSPLSLSSMLVKPLALRAVPTTMEVGTVVSFLATIAFGPMEVATSVDASAFQVLSPEPWSSNTAFS
jgi:hypothetical protein